MDDPFALSRFVDAQRDTYAPGLGELTAGTKRTHWMWLIFLQLKGLGSSPIAQLYAIGSLDETRADLQHPELGPRLQTCTAAANQVTGRISHQIFGSSDNLKLYSSMTLFAAALQRYYDGARDDRTLAGLRHA